MAGEELHAQGMEGTRRAKIWLERTTRADVPWVVPDRIAVPKLTFPWNPTRADTFSFDLGGMLRGGDVNGQQFYAECKYYAAAGNQGAMYKEYVAKCYSALRAQPHACDNFMWITWAPFATTIWPKLLTADYVEGAVLTHHERVLATASAAAATTSLNKDLASQVADRLWIIVLSDRQEQHLVMSDKHLGLIRSYETSGAVQ